jgi:hypothetical protein
MAERLGLSFGGFNGPYFLSMFSPAVEDKGMAIIKDNNKTKRDHLGNLIIISSRIGESG